MSQEKEDAAAKGKGYMGKVLWVDLSTGKHDVEEIPEETFRLFLGGYGLGAKLLYDRMRPKVDPLGPENIIGFCSGLLTATGSLFSGRFMVVGKSPLTGGWGDSNCGGHFSPMIKRCGYDAIFFTGISEKPVYAYITESSVELIDADGIWGKDAIEAEEIFWEKHGKRCQVAGIGQSGEKVSLISGVVNDRGRIAARSGLGAIMGSKKLKAVVLNGREKIGVEDKTKIKGLSKSFKRRHDKGELMEKLLTTGVLKFAGKMIRGSKFYTRQPGDMWRMILRKFGTPGITTMSAESGDSPVKNWGGSGHSDFPIPTHSSKIGPDKILKYQTKRYACYSCPLGCGGICEVNEGPYKIKEVHKPEYETLCALGTLILCEDVFAIYKLNDMLNRAGMDSISAGGSIAFAIECFENGIITEKDTDGIVLKWGDADAIIKLVEKMIKREGIGDLLADGVKIAAEKIGKGSEKYAIHAGGQEVPMHDPKFDPGFGTAYYVEPTPGRHTIASGTYLELMALEQKFKEAKKAPFVTTRKERFTYNNKGKGQAINSKYAQVGNAAGMCIFGLQVGGNIPLFEWINAATGWTFTNEDYLVTGERIETLRHCFNLREGIHPLKDFKPSDRVWGKEPLKRGPHKGVTLDIDQLAKDFYKEFDWDTETCLPSRDKLKELKLDFVLNDLYGDEHKGK